MWVEVVQRLNENQGLLAAIGVAVGVAAVLFSTAWRPLAVVLLVSSLGFGVWFYVLQPFMPNLFPGAARPHDDIADQGPLPALAMSRSECRQTWARTYVTRASSSHPEYFELTDSVGPFRMDVPNFLTRSVQTERGAKFLDAQGALSFFYEAGEDCAVTNAAQLQAWMQRAYEERVNAANVDGEKSGDFRILRGSFYAVTWADKAGIDNYDCFAATIRDGHMQWAHFRYRWPQRDDMRYEAELEHMIDTLRLTVGLSSQKAR